MQQQRFQERVRIIAGSLAAFLRQFSVPNPLDTDELQMDRIRMTAEAINSQIDVKASNEEVKHRVSCCFEYIVRTFKGNAWPSPAHFADAMRETVPKQVGNQEPARNLPHPPSMSLREIRWRKNYEGAKYHLSPEENEIAKTQPIPRCEREHHEAVMSELVFSNYG